MGLEMTASLPEDATRPGMGPDDARWSRKAGARRAIDVIYIGAGGGHRAAANALAEVIARQKRPWDLRQFNIQDLLYPIDFIRKATGLPFQDVYNVMLRRGWTRGTSQLIPAMHALIRLSHPSQVRVLEAHFRQTRPDMVVSLIPHYNRAIKEALERAQPGAPLVTVMTDIADYPPHFWIERQDQYVICGSDRAVQQARELGMPEGRVIRVSGMILDPRFYEPFRLDRNAEIARLGLRPGTPTGLVMFGGEGSRAQVGIARALNASGLAIQLIVLCGRNERALLKLRGVVPRIPMVVIGFTRKIPHYMYLADFFIGKAGPGSISEALAMQLPVIVERNAWTMAHERYNADWIRERDVGIVLSGFSQISDGVREMLRPQRYCRFRENAAAVRNTAVFEIPDLLNTILAHRV